MDRLTNPLTVRQLWVCTDGSIRKFSGDVQSYKVGTSFIFDIFSTKELQELIVKGIKAAP